MLFCGRSERRRACRDKDTAVGVQRRSVDWAVIGAMYFYGRMDRQAEKLKQALQSRSCEAFSSVARYIHVSRPIIVVPFCCSGLFAWIQFLCWLNLSDTTVRLRIYAMFLIISPQKSLLIISMRAYEISPDQVPCPHLQLFVSHLHKTESSHVLFFYSTKILLQIKFHIRQGSNYLTTLRCS
jgi:hypothetical protein